MGGTDERDLVRRGYDALSYHYRSGDADDGEYAPWLVDLQGRLPVSGAVLDLGCGCGVPVARFLADAGYHVTGVDISDVQIERARRLVPAGTFVRADATRLTTAGNSAWTGTEDNWLGGPATMWWSHADAPTYRSWLQQAGLTISAEEFIPEGAGGHALFWAQRPPG